MSYLILSYLIEGNMRCINLAWTKCDVTYGLHVKCTARHCGEGAMPGGGQVCCEFRDDDDDH